MKYRVSIKLEGMEVAFYENCTQEEAEAIAAREAAKPENEFYQIFVEWFRRSDGQKGYLNPDGNHAIAGKSWHIVEA